MPGWTSEQARGALGPVEQQDGVDADIKPTLVKEAGDGARGGGALQDQLPALALMG